MAILIINHDVVFLNDVKNAFEEHGYKVIATTNSLLAEKLFFQHKPVAIIVSASMPNKDGFEITREIRTVCKKTYILVVSPNPNYLRAIKKLGANEALPDSVEPKQIVSIVKRVYQG